jgi:hypothetical protein
MTSEAGEFPYDEIKDDISGGNGDYFDNPQDALDALIKHHMAYGWSSDNVPTIDNVWLVTHCEEEEPTIKKNENGEPEGALKLFFTYEPASNYCSSAITTLGFIGTEEKRTSPDETYIDSEIIKYTLDELENFHPETLESFLLDGGQIEFNGTSGR